MAYGKKLILSALALALASAPLRAQAVNALTPAETAAGWKLLFNGKTNAGWVRTDGSAGRFVLEDSALKTKDGDICTQDEYADFEFSVDYKYNAGGNSGIFLRTKRGIDPPWLSGMEVAIQDNGRAGNLYKNGDAALYDVKAPSVDTWTGPLKWNHLVVRLVGNNLEHWHNGKKVLGLTLGTPEWDKLVAASKFSDAEFVQAGWGKEKTGQICLQDHGGTLIAWFRNIKVLKVDAASPVAKASPATARAWTWDGHGIRWSAPVAAAARIEFIPVSGGTAMTFRMNAGGVRLGADGLASGIYVMRVSAGAHASRGLVRVP